MPYFIFHFLIYQYHPADWVYQQTWRMQRATTRFKRCSFSAVFHLLTVVSYGSCAKRVSGLFRGSPSHQMLRTSAPFKIYNGKTALGRKAFLDPFPGPVVLLKRPTFYVFGKQKKRGSRAGSVHLCKKSRGAQTSPLEQEVDVWAKGSDHGELRFRNTPRVRDSVAFLCFSLYALVKKTFMRTFACIL